MPGSPKTIQQRKGSHILKVLDGPSGLDREYFNFFYMYTSCTKACRKIFDLWLFYFVLNTGSLVYFGI